MSSGSISCAVFHKLVALAFVTVAVGAKGVRVVRQKQVRYKPLEQRRALIGGLVGEGLSACLGLAGDGSASVGFQWASSAG